MGNSADLRAIVVNVDYSDYFAITMPYNRHHFSEVWVVTTPEDHEAIALAEQNDCSVYLTKAFYEDGASFNKYLALERGFEAMGRHGWLVILDADVLWPQVLPETPLQVGKLYVPWRRMLKDVSGGIPPEDFWAMLPRHVNRRDFVGYSQIFHGADPHLGPAPWHETNWRHAGGGDHFFQAKWPLKSKVRPGWEVLHLGEAEANWFGRASAYVDGQQPAQSKQLLAKMRDLWNKRYRGMKPKRDKYGLLEHRHVSSERTKRGKREL